MSDIFERIKQEREEIRQQGEQLGAEIDIALGTNAPLPHNYAIRLLKLIAKIAQHDINYRGKYGDGEECVKKRRSNLGNLANTTRLFSRNTTGNNPKHYYINDANGYMGTNIFDDLAHLCLFDIIAYTTPLGRPLFAISDNDVFTILNDICASFVTIARVETFALTHEDIGVGSRPALEATRTFYKDHRNLPELFTFISCHRERTHIESAMQAIRTIMSIPLDPRLPQNQLIVNKRALLRCLTVVGEAFTQSNLTTATRRLSRLEQRDFQLFKDIRDKLAHNEHDIHPNKVRGFIEAVSNIEPFMRELTTLSGELEQMQRELIKMHREGSLRGHYLTPIAAAVVPPSVDRFPNIGVFLRKVLSGDQYPQDQRKYPAEFTTLAMANKIIEELQEATNLIDSIPGHETLHEPHEENICSIIRPFDQIFIKVMQEVNNQFKDAELDKAIHIIKTINPEFIDMPKGSLDEVFKEEPQGSGHIIVNMQLINANFHSFAAYIKQYANKLQFVHFLRSNILTDWTIEYHIGRIVKFLSVIPEAQLNNLLQGILSEPEIRTFRNAIEHDAIYEVEITGMPKEEFTCRYLALLYKILPNLSHIQQLSGAAPAVGRAAPATASSTASAAASTAPILRDIVPSKKGLNIQRLKPTASVAAPQPVLFAAAPQGGIERKPSPEPEVPSQPQIVTPPLSAPGPGLLVHPDKSSAPKPRQSLTPL